MQSITNIQEQSTNNIIQASRKEKKLKGQISQMFPSFPIAGVDRFFLRGWTEKEVICSHQSAASAERAMRAVNNPKLLRRIKISSASLELSRYVYSILVDSVSRVGLRQSKRRKSSFIQSSRYRKGNQEFQKSSYCWKLISITYMQSFHPRFRGFHKFILNFWMYTHNY